VISSVPRKRKARYFGRNVFQEILSLQGPDEEQRMNSANGIRCIFSFRVIFNMKCRRRWFNQAKANSHVVPNEAGKKQAP
jgi:hypothetical protein